MSFQLVQMNAKYSIMIPVTLVIYTLYCSDDKYIFSSEIINIYLW